MEHLSGNQNIEKYERGYAMVDLDAAAANVEAMAANLKEGVKILGTVKADGYGHGAVQIAHAISPYVQGFAVASVDEGLILQRHGITKPVLILGVTGESRFQEIIDSGIRPALFQYEKAKILSEQAVLAGKSVKIHLAVDTGMSRIGVQTDEKGLETAVNISRLPGIETEGIFTHFARADEGDKQYMEEQFRRFSDFIERLEERGVKIPLRHCSNSAGIIDARGVNMDLVRAGISIYGLYPSDEVRKDQVPLKPVMSWKSFISFIKILPAGTPVSYGGTYVTEKETKVATIPTGYGDGYPRSLSGKGFVLVRGKRAPILGRICMDQFMVDVSAIDSVKEGDEVTLLGQDGEEEIRAEELARTGGGFHYEILCNIGKRIPRVYLRNHQIVETKDYFSE